MEAILSTTNPAGTASSDEGMPDWPDYLAPPFWRRVVEVKETLPDGKVVRRMIEEISD